MPVRISIDTFFEKQPLLPLIDVRTPAEFENGHIPGAVNIPLFSNEERAEVGTVYKQVSPEKAYDLGYQMVEPKLDEFVRKSKKVSKPNGVLVYCWRGGMRSRSFAEHIEAQGIENVHVLEGGYKAFRQFALEAFNQPGQLKILGGYTGSGKTRVLKILREMGKQVIDLEGIAHHKGSAFGSIGQPEQPPNEHFANLLFWEWRKLDYTKMVWLEDESIHIGKVFIPEILFERMREAPVTFLKIPREERAKLLVEEYVGTDKAPLIHSIQKISKRLGGLMTQEAIEAVERSDYYTAALATLHYYDKFYKKGLEHRKQEQVRVIESNSTDARKNAELVLKLEGIYSSR